MESTCTAIDGSAVTIDAIEHNPDYHPSSVGVYLVDGSPWELTASYLGFGRAVAADVGVVLSESYTLQGGTLLLGSGPAEFPSGTAELALGVWEGRRFSVHGHLYNGQAQTLIGVFNSFHIVEDDSGIRIVPKDPQRATPAKEPLVLREIPRVGLLQIQPMTPQLARAMPRWRGAPVRGGELFVGRRPGSLHMVLAGPRSHTLIMRQGEDCGKQDMTHVVGLTVDWRHRVGRS